MVIETFILDEKNFGDAQKAYDSYPLALKELENNLNGYQQALHSINSDNLSKVTKKDMKKIDALAEKTEISQKQCAALKTALFQNFEYMATETQNIQQDLLSQTDMIPQDFDFNYGKSLFNEAYILKSENKVCAALDKMYAAHEYFNSAYSDIRSQWMVQHQNKIQSIMNEISF